MKCSKCGNEIGQAEAFCPECGAPLTNKKSTLSNPVKALIAIALIIAIIAGVLVCCSAVKNKSSQEEAFRNKLMELTDKPIIEFCCTDFNMDSAEEAFAVAGEGTADSFTDAEIWFVSEEAAEMVKDNFSGKCNGLLEAEEMKYVSVEVNNEKNNTSTSFIYGVETADKYFEPEISGMYSGVHQDGGRIITADGEEIKILRNPKHTLADSQNMSQTSAETTSATQKKTTTTTTASTTTKMTKKTASKKAEDIVDIYFDNISVWEKKEYDVNGSVIYMFLDFDFDGILELVVSDLQGTGRFSYNTYYAVDVKNRTIKKLKNAQQDYGQIDWSGTELDLYKGPDGMFYLGVDFEKAGNGIFASTYQKITFKNSTVYGENLFYNGQDVSYGSSEAPPEPVKIYGAFSGNESHEISESEYNAKLNELHSQNTSMHLKVDGASNRNFNDLSNTEKKKELLRIYKSFSYDGFKS